MEHARVEPKYEVASAIAETVRAPEKEEQRVRVVPDPVRITYRNDSARGTWESQGWQLRKLEERLDLLEGRVNRHICCGADIAHKF